MTVVPFVQDADLSLYVGDALSVLRELPSGSVHCALTSPPFYGLRDYGTGSWEGGTEGCDHAPVTGLQGQTGQRASRTFTGSKPQGPTCSRCGAIRIDQQIGLEATPEEWVARLVEVFREVRRVLRRDGTCWIECGDSYCANTGTSFGTDKAITGTGKGGGRADDPDMPRPTAWGGNATTPMRHPTKPKDLLLQPFMLAMALRADGWWLRQAIIWHKPNAMPESATDRCTTAHSYVFLLSKSARYFFDADAIAEPAAWERWGDQTVPKHEGTDTAAGWMQPQSRDELREKYLNRSPDGAGRIAEPLVKSIGGHADRADGMKNPRSVWTIPTRGFPGAHFATWPEELCARIIKAGTSERGCCPECGAPWARETDVEYVKSPVHGAGSVVGRHEATGANNYDGAGMPRLNKQTTTTGWRSTCEHDHEPVPATVLDPFAGSGTTGLVARKLGRRSVLIELSEEYARMAADRLSQLSLLAEETA